MRSNRFVLQLLLLIAAVQAYPVIVQIEEHSQRCLRLNIPQDDDSHLVFLVLPNPDDLPDERLESWYVEQVYRMTKLKSQHEILPKKLPEPPPKEISDLQQAYMQSRRDNNSPLRIAISDQPTAEGDGANAPFSYRTKYFIPHVINYVRKLTRGRPRSWEEAQMEGYGICLVNEDPDNVVQVVFDSILVSEDVEDDDTVKKPSLDKDRHLTPLEESLERSISAAQTVLREMKFLEMREARMRQTAESINTRVRWFSYLSVGVLLSVTYIQVSYLKRYFRKKKLM
jgi:p24 family protein delta-1